MNEMNVDLLTPDEYADMSGWLHARGEPNRQQWPGWEAVNDREARIAQAAAENRSYSWVLKFESLTAPWRKDFDAWRTEHPTTPLHDWSGWTESKSERRSDEAITHLEPGFYWYQQPGETAQVVSVAADGEVAFIGTDYIGYLPDTSAGFMRHRELPHCGVFSSRLLPPNLC